MTNPYTGDFDVVGQVTEGTLNRLVASIHQNSYRNTTVPSVPHGSQLRIDASPPGTPTGDQLRGTAHAQVAVPRIELIDRSTSSIWVDLWARAEYFPDPSTAHIPRFVNGSVRVMYDIDGHSAAGQAWPKAEPNTLTVNMTAEDLIILPKRTKPDPKVPGRITDIVRHLLINDFAIPPIQMPSGVRLDQLVCLRPPGADPVVAIPFALSGQPVGNVDSVTSTFTEGRDFAVAITSAAIMREVNNALAALKHWKETTVITLQVGGDVDLPVIGTVDIGVSKTITYTSTVGQPVATWEPNGRSATIHIDVAGTSMSDSWLAPNADFDISVDLALGFDPLSGSLTISAGSPTVSPNVHGPLGGALNGTVQSRIESALNTYLPSAVAGAQQQLTGASSQIGGVAKTFQTLDAGARLSWNDAEFNRDAVVMRGTVDVTAREKPSISFSRSHELVYNAFDTWIPGGRVDAYEWAWIPYWETLNLNRTPDEVIEDRYELIPDTLPALSKFGKPQGPPPDVGVRLPPTTDFEGAMLLRIRGVVVDVHTGALVPIESAWVWKVYGRAPALPPGVAKALKDRHIVAGPRRLGPGEPVMTGVFVNDPPGTNTLYVHAGSKWSSALEKALTQGLEACSRSDAGLLVAVLLDSAAFTGIDKKAARSLSRFLDKLPAPSMVLEDVEGLWGASIGRKARRGARWCIQGPGGGLLWATSGDLEGEALAKALDYYLVPAAQTLPVALDPDPRSLVRCVNSLVRSKGDAARPDAPYGNATLTMFVSAASAPSAAAIGGLAEAIRSERLAGHATTVVVWGATAKEAKAATSELGKGVTVVPDPDGSITRQCDVGFLPTTVTLSSRGRVLTSRVGIASNPTTTGGRGR